jgi:hypothetical protein
MSLNSCIFVFGPSFAGKLRIDGSILAIAGNYEEAVQIWRNLA